MVETSERSAAQALDGALTALAERHDFSVEAVDMMWQAVRRGGGAMAQFSHPEFGGRGQWMRNGMVMVGDMFNRQLSSRVGELGADLATLYLAHPEFANGSTTAPGATGGSNAWWPQEFGDPSSVGSQNGMRYAWFPSHRRLVIDREGRSEMYDTADHVIGGVSQQQGGARTMSFTSQHGPIDLGTLKRLDEKRIGSQTAAVVRDAAQTDIDGDDAEPALPPFAAAPTAMARSHDGLLDTIARLADLHGKGVLTDEEFQDKKTELLGRL